MNRIVISGATSMIGIALCKYALKNNILVIAIVRKNSMKRKYLPKSSFLEIIECNCEEYELLHVVQDADVFVHLAWSNTEVQNRNDVKKQLDNVGYEIQAIHLAHRFKCKKFVGIGSQAEYGQHKVGLPTAPDSSINPESGYGVAKYAAYKMGKILCRELNIEFCWARVFSVYGEYDSPQTLIMSCIAGFVNNQDISLTNCDQIWDYLYIADVAKAIFLICQSGIDEVVYCVGSGKCKKLKDYVEIIKKSVQTVAKPIYGKKDYFLNQPMYLCADITKLEEDTGFRPTYTFEEGIKKTIKWYRGEAES